jgi:hypothetical protein
LLKFNILGITIKFELLGAFGIYNWKRNCNNCSSKESDEFMQGAELEDEGTSSLMAGESANTAGFFIFPDGRF